jgi:hypothetical protein
MYFNAEVTMTINSLQQIFNHVEHHMLKDCRNAKMENESFGEFVRTSQSEIMLKNFSL